MSPPLLIYRVGNFFHKSGLKFLGKYLTWLNRLIFSTMIPSSATIGKNVKLGYWGLGIVLHSDAVVGDNCWILQNVTIGRNNKDAKPPSLGQNVMVGAGAVIIGDIEIGNNAMIGANSVVTKSVPANVVFAGVPAIKIREIDPVPTVPHYNNRHPEVIN